MTSFKLRPRATAIIIPCLNEEEPISDVVREVLAEGIGEVIVVDNGSTDRTAERAGGRGSSASRCVVMAGPAQRASRPSSQVRRSSASLTATAAMSPPSSALSSRQ
jgi:cellulose synthase/poly-beta-1,6-N-acetylglucosamine synthase-like glycosyltransferase